MADKEPVDSADVFDASLKKKKKKTKVVAFADEVDSLAPEQHADDNKPAEEAEESVDAMFADLKKKKKKKKTESSAVENLEDSISKVTLDASASAEQKEPNVPDEINEDEAGEEGSDHDELVYSDHEHPGEFDAAPEEELGNPEDAWKNSDRDYTYRELLSRVFRTIRQINPELSGEKRRYTMIPPSVAREGSKKTVFANIADICNRMRRSPEHLIAYIFAELGTQGSVDGSQRLVIKGRFQQKQIENVLRHYILEYVTCKTCRSPETNLRKENRLFFLQCESCGSSRAVTAIKSGFMAQTTKRKLTRQQ